MPLNYLSNPQGYQGQGIRWGNWHLFLIECAFDCLILLQDYKSMSEIDRIQIENVYQSLFHS